MEQNEWSTFKEALLVHVCRQAWLSYMSYGRMGIVVQRRWRRAPYSLQIGKGGRLRSYKACCTDPDSGP